MDTRITSDKSIKNLKQTLLAVDWSALQSSSDVHSAYDLFLSKFLEIYNRELPVVNQIFICIQTRKPSIEAGIRRNAICHSN